MHKISREFPGRNSHGSTRMAGSGPRIAEGIPRILPVRAAVAAARVDRFPLVTEEKRRQ